MVLNKMCLNKGEILNNENSKTNSSNSSANTYNTS